MSQGKGCALAHNVSSVMLRRFFSLITSTITANTEMQISHVLIFDGLAWRRTKKFPILKLDFGAIKSSRQKRFYCGFDGGANLKYANIDARKGFCAGDAATGGFAHRLRGRCDGWQCTPSSVKRWFMRSNFDVILLPFCRADGAAARAACAPLKRAFAHTKKKLLNKGIY